MRMNITKRRCLRCIASCVEQKRKNRTHLDKNVVLNLLQRCTIIKSKFWKAAERFVHSPNDPSLVLSVRLRRFRLACE